MLPFFRNDGYFLLEELTRTSNLAARARQAMASTFTAGASARASREGTEWWLPWYALFEFVYAALLTVLGFAVLGRLFQQVGPALALGILAAIGHSVHRYRLILRAAVPRNR